jgi:hypothetical protein
VRGTMASPLVDSRFIPPLFPTLGSMVENSIVPPGLELLCPSYPALKRWAIVGCPSGAGLNRAGLNRGWIEPRDG